MGRFPDEWFQANEGAKFWAKVLNDLRNRGVQDILIAVVDGLKGFPQAIEAAFPQTRVLTCIVHLLRHSMSFARINRSAEQDRKAVYTAVDAEAAEAALAAFEDSDLDAKYPAIAPSWRRAWNDGLRPFVHLNDPLDHSSLREQFQTPVSGRPARREVVAGFQTSS